MNKFIKIRKEFLLLKIFNKNSYDKIKYLVYINSAKEFLK